MSTAAADTARSLLRQQFDWEDTPPVARGLDDAFAAVLAEVFERVMRRHRTEPAPTVLTVEQAAEHLQVDKSTVYRAINAGTLPALKVGREFRLSSRAIHDALTGGLS